MSVSWGSNSCSNTARECISTDRQHPATPGWQATLGLARTLHRGRSTSDPSEKSMRVAVAIFGSRSSPRAECCSAVLVADIFDGHAEPIGTLTAPGVVIADRVAALRQARVEILVCNGITREAAQAVRAAGIRVIADVRGEAEEILRDLATGALSLEPTASVAAAR
jgi:predicted Fe-Mo cluster-binding NifX family protein